MCRQTSIYGVKSNIDCLINEQTFNANSKFTTNFHWHHINERTSFNGLFQCNITIRLERNSISLPVARKLNFISLILYGYGRIADTYVHIVNKGKFLRVVWIILHLKFTKECLSNYLNMEKRWNVPCNTRLVLSTFHDILFIQFQIAERMEC